MDPISLLKSHTLAGSSHYKKLKSVIKDYLMIFSGIIKSKIDLIGTVSMNL